MSHETYINLRVLEDALPFVEATHAHNVRAMKNGMPSHTSSSMYPTFTGYNSNFTTVNPKNENALDSQFSFIRPKTRIPAFLTDNKDINFDAMKNCMKYILN